MSKFSNCNPTQNNQNLFIQKRSLKNESELDRIYFGAVEE